MKKIKYILLCFVLFLVFGVNVYAENYSDLNKLDLEKGWKEVKLNLDGYNTTIKYVTEDNDGNYILVAEYEESSFGIVNSYGTKNSQMKHTKLIKVDKNFNKVYEKNYFILGNWELPDPYAPTVGTMPYDVVVLKDNSILVTGFTWGLIRPVTEIPDDNMDAMFVRFDSNGNVIHENLIYNVGLDHAVAAAALTDGGYIVKLYGFYNGKGEFTFSGYDSHNPTGYYFLVYDANNNIVESFMDKEIDRLNKYSFIEAHSYNKLKYTLHRTFYGQYDEDGVSYSHAWYLGDYIDGSPVTLFGIKNMMRSKWDQGLNGEDISNAGISVSPRSGRPSEVLFFKDGSMLFEDKLYDSKMSFVKKIESLPDGLYYYTTKNGAIINYDLSSYNPRTWLNEEDLGRARFYVNVPTGLELEESDNVSDKKEPAKSNVQELKQEEVKIVKTNYIINDKKIDYDLTTFIENDRTYINLESLCSAMDCVISKSDVNPDTIILRFNVLNGNKQIPENTDIDLSVMSSASYAIVHEVGTKKYDTYLEFYGSKVFSLKSPTLSDNAIDVVSKKLDGDIYVPLRFVAEALGRYVEYIPGSQSADGIPTVKIYSQGEGEFYEKYDIGLSKTKISNYSTFTNAINDNKITLNQSSPLYAYGYEKNTKRIINIDESIFYPISENFAFTDEERAEFGDIQDVKTDSDYRYDVATNKAYYICEDNSIYKYKDLDASINSDMYVTTVVVSNIEGYPFIKLVSIK